MSKELKNVATEEEVVIMQQPIEEVVTQEIIEEPKVLGKFKKSTLIKAGVGVAVLAGGLYILSKAKDYDTVTEIIESVEE